MICNMCGSNNLDQAKFCSQCASPLVHGISLEKSASTIEASVTNQNYNTQNVNNNQNNINSQNNNNNKSKNIFVRGFRELFMLDDAQTYTNNQNYSVLQNTNNNPNFNNNQNNINFRQPLPIKTYMTSSIILLIVAVVTICCYGYLFPIPIALAILSLTFAVKCDRANLAGNKDLALLLSRKAKRFFFIALACIIAILVYKFVLVVYLAIGFMNSLPSINMDDFKDSDGMKKIQDMLEDYINKQGSAI